MTTHKSATDAAGSVQVAEGADDSDGRRRRAGGAWVSLCNRKQFAFSWLLAFMFFLSLCLGALVPGAGASSVRRRLVGADPAVPASTSPRILFPVDGVAVHPDRAPGQDPLRLDEPGSDIRITRCTPSSRCSTMPAFYVVAGVLFPGLVVAVQPAALLVAEAGRNRRRRSPPTGCGSTPASASSCSPSR